MSPDAPVRPLVVRFGALGDMVKLIAFLRALSDSWGTRCDLLAGSGFRPELYAGLGLLHDVRTLRSRRTPYLLSREQQRLVGWLRRRGLSPAYIFEKNSKVAAKLSWLLARGGLDVSHQVGPGDVVRGRLEHFLPYSRRLAAATPGAWTSYRRRGVPGGVEPQLVVSAAQRRDCRSWLERHGWLDRPLVLLQPHSRRSNRGRWPRQAWVALARHVLASLPAARVLILGSSKEAAESAALAADIADRRVSSVAAELPLGRLVALVEQAHSLVSLDTGPAHIAAALRCPVVVLMGMADPRRNHPVAPRERLEVVTAWPREEWPREPDTWAATHRLGEIVLHDVVDAWERLRAGRDGPATKPHGPSI